MVLVCDIQGMAFRGGAEAAQAGQAAQQASKKFYPFFFDIAAQRASREFLPRDLLGKNSV